MEQTVKDKSSELFIGHPALFTLVALPIELLVYIFSFVTSTRDRVKLRYISQLLKAAVETPSLWRDFIWPHYDFREKRCIENVLKSCGRHVKQLSFPNHAIHVKSLQYCNNVLRLSLPSVKLSVNQLRTIMQSMKKLQYLDVLWVSKNGVKLLLLIVGYPVYGRTIKELTIREQVKDSSRTEALVFLLNEWTASMLVPHTLNVVSDGKIGHVLHYWWMLFKNSVSQPHHHVGYFNLYCAFRNIIDLVPVFPLLRIEISFMPSFNTSFVIAKNCGLSGLEQDHILLNEHSTANGYVLHKGVVKNSYHLHRTPMNINNIEFLTRFSATKCGFFSEHLEQLAIACPNLQQLNLKENVNCLKSLQGLRAIATHRKLEGLNILEISLGELESCVKLWEILVDLQLTYLAIDLCCLLCSEEDNHTKESIISLHQKCLKLKALESYATCTKCFEVEDLLETEELLLQFNFLSLIHCVTDIDNVNIGDRLKYLYYVSDRHSWEMANCNLEQVCILADSFSLPDNFMITLSAHGGLVHVFLCAKFVTQTGIAALIGNSPNLISCHVYSTSLCMSRDFRLRLKKKYAHRKLFLCGSYCFVKRKENDKELRRLVFRYNMDCVSLWSYSH